MDGSEDDSLYEEDFKDMCGQWSVQDFESNNSNNYNNEAVGLYTGIQ